MKLVFPSVLFIFGIASVALCSADDSPPDEDSCVFHVGDEYSESCDKHDTIDVVDRRGFRSTFTNLRRSRRFWYGENSKGTSLSYVRSKEGKMHGSLVDVEIGEVTQIRVEKGTVVAVTTDSSAFGEELDPPNESDPKERKLLSKTTVNSSSAIQSHDYQDQATSTNSERIDSTPSNRNKTTSRSLDDSGDVLDVMVVWTKDAECRNAGFSVGCTLTDSTAADMQATIDLAIEETNTAYDLSFADTQLLLVHSYRHPTYTATGFSNALYDMRDGDVDGVHEKREEYGADIVALIIDDPQYCGIAFIGPSKANMYSVTAWNCATGYFSFGHEIGHNLGLQHDRGTSGVCNNVGYSYGYRDPSANFRSILAYNCVSGQCDNNAGNGCTRIIRFSNPSAEGHNNQPVGDAFNDNSRRINDVRATVAAYYTHVNPEPTVSPAPTPTPTICTGDDVTVELTTDNFPSETYWSITTKNEGAVVMQSGALSVATTYVTTACLPTNCYVFEITDSYGDGICCGWGIGSFSVLQDGTEIFSGGDFDSSASTEFCVDDDTSPTRSPSSSPTVAPSSLVSFDSSLPIAYSGSHASVPCDFVLDLVSA